MGRRQALGLGRSPTAGGAAGEAARGKFYKRRAQRQKATVAVGVAAVAYKGARSAHRRRKAIKAGNQARDRKGRFR